MRLTRVNLGALALVWMLTCPAWSQQGEIQFTLNQDAVEINRVFVLPGTSTPCRGDELSAELVAQYAEVKLLSHYNILERKYLDMVLKEQQLGMSGLIYESEAVEAGCLQGSEGIIFCEVGCLVSQSMVKLKLIDCKESAQQWNALSIGTDLRSLFSEVSLGIESGESRSVTVDSATPRAKPKALPSEKEDEENGEANGAVLETSSCMDEAACNFNTDSNEPCRYLDAVGECGGVCSEDVDEDGICDVIDDCFGEFDACGRCNGPGPVYECGCTSIEPGKCNCLGDVLDVLGKCGGTCTKDEDGDGLCDDLDECVGELDECGRCNGRGPVYECGCTSIEPGKCNCLGDELDALGKCGGNCVKDDDGDGVCDDLDECVGEFDECGICNGPGAIYDCGCRGVPRGDCDCDGRVVDAIGVCGGGCWKDSNHDGVCDELEGCGADDVVFHQGVAYQVQTFGNQCWMAESLRYIPRESAIRVWDVDLPHAYAVMDSTSAAGETHILYNFKAIQDWNLCPSGWKIPNEEDWRGLEETLGIGQLELDNRGHRTWSEQFSEDLWALFGPDFGGIRYGDGSLERSGTGGGYWTSTERGLSHAWYRLHSQDRSGIHRDYIFGKPTGLSVRCIRNPLN